MSKRLNMGEIMSIKTKHGHVTFGVQGQHEVYLPTTGNGHENRRDRRKCRYYYPDSKYCDKISSFCVGPTICRKYNPIESHKSSQHLAKCYPTIGATIYNKKGNKGKIVSISRDICTVAFETGRVASTKYPDAFENGTLRTDKSI